MNKTLRSQSSFLSPSMRPSVEGGFHKRKNSYNEDLKVVPSNTEENIFKVVSEPSPFKLESASSGLYGALKMVKQSKPSTHAKKPAIKKIAPGRPKISSQSTMNLS